MFFFKMKIAMKPLVKYRGGKSNEIPNIEKHIPRYKGRYIEPFFGGEALYFHLEPKRAVINDINSKLMAFYSGVKNDFLIYTTHFLIATYVTNYKTLFCNRGRCIKRKQFLNFQ